MLEDSGGTLNRSYPYVELALASTAGALWYLVPEIGPWPLLLILAAWAGRIFIKRSVGPLTAIEIPLFLFLVTAAIGVWSSYNQQAALNKFWLIVASIAIFYAFVHLLISGLDSAVEHSLLLLLLFGMGVSGYFILTHDWTAYPTKFQTLQSLGEMLQLPGLSLPGHRLHPNVAAGMMAMTMPFGVAAAYMAKKNQKQWQFYAAVIGILVILLGLLLSSSRSAWVSLAAAGLFVLMLRFIRYLSVDTGVNSRWLLTAGLVLAVGMGVIIIFVPSIRSTFLDLVPLSPSGVSRITLMRDGLAIANDYPLIGAGIGGYTMLYSTYSFLLHVGFEVHTHNIFLNVSIQQGLIALGSLLWIWLTVGRALWISTTSERSNSDSDDGKKDSPAQARLILYAGAVSLTVILTHGLVDDALYGSRAVLLLFVPVAFTIPTIISLPKPSTRRRIIYGSILASLLIIVGVFFWRPITSLAVSNVASVRQSKAELSQYEWPAWPIQDELRTDIDLSDSIAGYEQALSLYERNGSAARRLGQIELSLGEYEDALNHLKLAYEVAPWDNATRQLLGEGYLVNGFIEEGRLLWQTVNNGQDQLKVREFWYESLEDELRVDWIQQGQK